MPLRGPPDGRTPTDLLRFGVVNLDKPPGPSAHQVTGWVRDLADDALAGKTGGDVHVERAAHVGTLDPKATGCLPVLLGDATRIAQAFDDAVKEYVVVLELHRPIPGDLPDVAAAFEGPIYQKPPRKSAVRRKLRVRTVHALNALEVEERRALLRVECEAGTYVRKLCHDLGLALGTGAHMGDLRRTRTGTFNDAALVSMHDLADAFTFWVEHGETETLSEFVRPAERALRGIPRVTVAESAAREIVEGAPVYAPGVLDVKGIDQDSRGDLVACYTPDGAAVCLGELVGDPAADEGTVVDLARVLV